MEKPDSFIKLFDPSYQAVQGAHVVAQFMMDYPKSEWKNGYLIFLAVESSHELNEWKDKLQSINDKQYDDRKKIPFSLFHEPDLDNQLTAIAVYTNGRMFKDLPIMAQKENEAVTS